MKKLLFIFAITTYLCFSTLAFADCKFNGKTYPEGSKKLPGYVCKKGSWQPQ